MLPALADIAAPRAASEPGRTAFGPTLAVTCGKCGAGSVATLSDEVSSINAAGGIRVDDPCPQCGGNLVAPASKYQLNDTTQMLQRVGDFEPQAAAAGSFPRPRIVSSVK